MSNEQLLNLRNVSYAVIKEIFDVFYADDLSDGLTHYDLLIRRLKNKKYRHFWAKDYPLLSTKHSLKTKILITADRYNYVCEKMLADISLFNSKYYRQESYLYQVFFQYLYARLYANDKKIFAKSQKQVDEAMHSVSYLWLKNKLVDR